MSRGGPTMLNQASRFDGDPNTSCDSQPSPALYLIAVDVNEQESWDINVDKIDKLG
jgi:hypothetical protein